MAIAPDSILGVAVDTVTEKMNFLQTLADKYNTLLIAALGAVGGVKVDEVPAPARPDVPRIAAPVVDLDTPPVLDAPALTIPEMPPPVDIDSLLADLDVGDMDALPDAPAPIAINIPPAPGLDAVARPARPDIDTTVELPAAPAIEMPEMEALTQITLPDFVFPQLPAFDARPPDPAGLAAPNVFINWAEPDYKSELLSELQARVRQWMGGGTGLPAPVEDALFACARERDSAETSRQVQEAVDTGQPEPGAVQDAGVYRAG